MTVTISFATAFYATLGALAAYYAVKVGVLIVGAVCAGLTALLDR